METRFDIANTNDIKIYAIGAGTWNSTFGQWLDSEFQYLTYPAIRSLSIPYIRSFQYQMKLKFFV